MEDHCVMCGEIIPEGRQICPVCEKKYGGSDNSEGQAAFLFGSPNPRGCLPSLIRREAVDPGGRKNHLSSLE